MPVPQAHLGVMEQVDGPEGALPQAGERAAPQHSRPGIERPARGQAFPPQVLGAEMARLERDRVVGVARVEPPAFMQQPMLGSQAPVEGSAGEGHQLREGRQQESVRHAEFDGTRKVPGRVGVAPEQEGSVHRHAEPAQLADGLLDAAVGFVDRLVHPEQVGGLETLEADEEAAATAAHDEIEQLGVACGVDAGLAHPAHPQRNQRPQEFLQAVGFAGQVVVDEEDEFRARAGRIRRGHFGDHLVDGALAVGVLKRGLHGAELARQPAAAADLDELDGQIALALENVPAVPQARERRERAGPVELLQTAISQIVQQPRPGLPGLSDDDGLGVLRHFLGAERGVNPAHRHRHAAPPVFARDLISAARGIGLDA